MCSLFSFLLCRGILSKKIVEFGYFAIKKLGHKLTENGNLGYTCAHLFAFSHLCPDLFILVGAPPPSLFLHSALWSKTDMEQGSWAVFSDSEYKCMYITIY